MNDAQQPGALDSTPQPRDPDDKADTSRAQRASKYRERRRNDPEFRDRERARDRSRKRRAQHARRERERYRRLYSVERLYLSARKRAARTEQPFTLTLEHLRTLWPEDGRCPVLGFRMILDRGSDEGPSLDKIDPARGYVEGNVRIISGRANRVKSDASLDEMRRLLDYMERADGR